ncbi:molybdate ABC transporter substrate-binding protein [Sulfitobacter sp. JB4-11]|uniref:molybdate ABC transporter substrate-binding protein n=1 Tax=Sulfitobacter rhodophyticola TaxID=3238304 RepID=UPI00351107ED
MTALWGAASAGLADTPRVTVFAAASLRGVLEDVAADHDIPLSLSFGGSGAMARQIAAGAPADLAILASKDWMAWLVSQGVVAPDAPQPVAGNALVLIGAKGAPAMADPATLKDRLGGGRLAMGQRDAVPAGVYARQWLEYAGLWPGIETHLAETDNVRAALALVARGDAPLGIVYASDATAEPRVSVVYEIPGHAHDPVTYPAAALTPAGERLLAHLLTPAVQGRFAAHGFAPVPP